MTSAPASSDNYCYRHPGRQSYVLCQRCARTVCPECQVQAAVGVHCVECAARDRQQAPRVKRGRPAILQNLTGSGAPVVTYAIIAVCVVVFLLQLIPGVTGALQFAGAYVMPASGISFEPWRMLTAVFVHGSILHLLFNMFTLFVFGSALERLLGRGRYLALYLISGFGGSVAVTLLTNPLQPVVGASGAIFGLMGAYFIINRHLGGNSVQLLVLVALNLAYGFFVPGISWQAHVGGLVAGALVALVYVRTRPRRLKTVQVLLVSAVAVALVAITAVRVLL
ncbi:rhomboid family intramembrane serine protease [Herbiconiux sp. KACC 21604]|uniref:rhomboid family intramembrane serine protease n=1 Tax=unclassified Herbiconiux TaxID=2618217 RepID=UPI0014923BC2|nr:rhomboid family intramembrane serine protease [Herbiconiux sp. SALV-R1]QJU55484.1 rhomboid family intramembrane serine protease [Herbiconiux sp. SALV-R1]WPO86668.1 rhomboid family intramembrane serine protease [Herbiconiux sp. KACC 21604]